MTFVHEPVLVRVPEHVEMRVYCSAEDLDPTVIEQHLLPLAEDAVGEPIRHSLRRGFPAPISGSVVEEVGKSWKSRSGVLLLSNKASSPNHVMVNARISPRRGPEGALERFGVFSLFIHEKAPKAQPVLRHLKDFVLATRASFGRADMPGWINTTPVILPLSATWHIKERLGWLTFLPDACTPRLRPVEAKLESVERIGHLLSCESQQACNDASALFAPAGLDCKSTPGD